MSFSETADFDLPQLEMLEHPLDQRQEQEGPGSGGKGFVSGPSEATWRQYMRPMQMIVLYETKTVRPLPTCRNGAAAGRFSLCTDLNLFSYIAVLLLPAVVRNRVEQSQYAIPHPQV